MDIYQQLSNKSGLCPEGMNFSGTLYRPDNRAVQAYAAYLLAGFCMPTLLSKKPSSLIRVDIQGEEYKNRLFFSINTVLEQFDCDYSILFENDSTLSLLVYHKKLLLNLLREKEMKAFLERNGLMADNMKLLFNSLSIKLDRYYTGKCKEFPHEIGVILGYPIQDVTGFIRNRGKNYILCGSWKVYHNADKAAEIFEEYKRIRNSALSFLLEGKKPEEMKPEQLKDFSL